MLETRRRAASAEGARIGAEGSERGGVLGEGVYPFQPTRGPGGASWAPPAGSGAARRQRILGIGLFQGLRSLLVETMHYRVYTVL